MHRRDTRLAIGESRRSRSTRRCIDLLHIVLNKSFLVPLTCLFQVVDFLLLFCHIELDKLYEVLVAALLTHYNVALVYLDKDLYRTEKIEAIAKTSHWQSTLHISQITANHLINKVSFDSSVVST